MPKSSDLFLVEKSKFLWRIGIFNMVVFLLESSPLRDRNEFLDTIPRSSAPFLGWLGSLMKARNHFFHDFVRKKYK